MKDLCELAGQHGIKRLKYGSVELEFEERWNEGAESLGKAQHSKQAAERIMKQLSLTHDQKAPDDEDAERRKPKYTFDDKFSEWEQAKRPGTVFDEGEE